MNNNDYNEPERDYSSPEVENPYAKPVYETAEEYNQARQEQQQAQAQGYAQSQPQTQSYAYNQFQTDYNSAGQSSNGGDSYNNSGYNYGNYNNYANYNGNGGYTNMGGTIIDSNGKELKNRFGIKLTLSIIEMLCCCTSCITLIMGIISCVFTCQANTSFKEGRFDDYKSKAKTSTVLLIVGAVFAAFAIISNVVSLVAMSQDGFWDEFMSEFEIAMEDELGYDIDMDTFWEDVYEGNYDDLYDESLEGDNYYSEYNEMADHPNFDDFNQIVVDGVTISLPCTYTDLVAAGFYADELELNATVKALDYGYLELNSPKKDYIADVLVVNNSDADATAENCMVTYMDFYYESEDENHIFDRIEFVNGLTVFMTVDETIDLLGEPNDIYMDDTEWGKLESYTWEYECLDGYYSFVTVSFYDGVIYDVQVNNGPNIY